MDEKINVNVLVEAKEEYTHQLCNVLKPMLIQGFDSIIDECMNTSEKKSVFKVFQSMLKKIPQWNQEMIEVEVKRIVKYSNCSWLDDLLTAVFVANAKILSSVRINDNNNNKINLVIPKLDNFIHNCYIESAREFYKNPLLFRSSGINYEKIQDNRERIEKIVEVAIRETIRKKLPVENILKDFLPTSNYESNNVSAIKEQQEEQQQPEAEQQPEEQQQTQEQEQTEEQDKESDTVLVDETDYLQNEVDNNRENVRNELNNLLNTNVSFNNFDTEDSHPEPEQIEESQPEAELVEESQPEPELVEESQPEPELVQESQPEPELVEESQPEPELVEESQPEPELIEESQPETELLQESQPEPELLQESQPEPELVEESQPEPEQVEESQPEPEVVEESQPEPKVVEESQPEPEVVEESQPEPEVVEESQPEPELLQESQPEPELVQELHPELKSQTEDEMKESVILPEKEDSPLNEKRRQLEKLRLELEEEERMEEQRRQEEQNRLEEQRRQEEQNRLEEQRRQEEQNRLEEQRRQEEQNRLEEQRRQEEQNRLEEERMEEQRRQEEQRRHNEEMKRRIEEQNRIEELEKAKMGLNNDYYRDDSTNDSSITDYYDTEGEGFDDVEFDFSDDEPFLDRNFKVLSQDKNIGKAMQQIEPYRKNFNQPKQDDNEEEKIKAEQLKDEINSINMKISELSKEETIKKEKKERKELPKDIKEVQITGVPKKAVPKRVMLFADAESDSGEN